MNDVKCTVHVCEVKTTGQADSVLKSFYFCPPFSVLCSIGMPMGLDQKRDGVSPMMYFALRT
jgi:hypothetical protein